MKNEEWICHNTYTHTSNLCEPFHPFKICMLYGHDARICKELLRIIVDELPVDEDIDVVLKEGVNLHKN